MALQLKIILLMLSVVFVGTFGQDELLPKPGECGALNETNMYNQKFTVEPGEFPWMAKIAYTKTSPNSPAFRCLAVLITERYLLSNSICFDELYDPYGVVLGDWDTIEEPDCGNGASCPHISGYEAIEDVIVHRRYQKTSYRYNIALIRLVKSVTFSKYIQPICLPDPDVVKMHFVTQHLQITGWYLRLEQKVKNFAHVMNLRDCRDAFEEETEENIEDIFESNQMMCAFSCQHRPTNMTTPDSWGNYLSGSALMGVTTVNSVPKSYYLIGLLPYTRIYCAKTYPDIISRIDVHLDWIKENIY